MMSLRVVLSITTFKVTTKQLNVLKCLRVVLSITTFKVLFNCSQAINVFESSVIYYYFQRCNDSKSTKASLRVVLSITTFKDKKSFA